MAAGFRGARASRVLVVSSRHDELPVTCGVIRRLLVPKLQRLLVPKLQLGNALVPEALLRRREAHAGMPIRCGRWGSGASKTSAFPSRSLGTRGGFRGIWQLPLQLALALLLLVARAAAEEPFAFATTPGKLPKSVVPTEYVITIMPDIKEGTFKGYVWIAIDIKEPTDRIVMNCLGLKITDAYLVGTPDQHLPATLDEEAQTLTLALTASLPVSSHALVIDFSGTLGEQPQGLYLSRYQKDGVEKKALATQFEPGDARRMFPCWDEPAFRVKIDLSVVVPEGLVVVSNMPARKRDGSVLIMPGVDRFDLTPPMPTYLLALFAGEFEKLEDEVDGVKLGIFTTPGKKEQARYAMEITKEIVKDFTEYFGVKYPLPKLDQIALPNTGAGGMENWGAIVYREDLLLFDPATSSQAQRERVYGIVAHEIAHQWFGNLVTMAWWDNLWLNEGFASWMATKQMARRHPEWKPWLRAAAGKEHAMRLDARATTHPIQQPVRTESEAGDAFDEITYQKGQAVIRMLEEWLGEEPFREGIRGYMKKHALSNTTTADLWDALGAASGKDVREFARDWTEQPGFPLVVVGSVRRTVLAGEDPAQPVWTQQRFTVHQKKAPELRWMIPLTTAPAGDPQRVLTELLAPGHFTYVRKDTETVDIANVGGAGYYRVQYPEETFKRLLKSLGHMAEADRLTLLNDTWALTQADRAAPPAYLLLADALLDTASPTELEQILGVLWQIDSMERGREQRAAFRQWALTFLRPQLAKLGWEPAKDEAPLITQLRPRVLALAGAFGDTETLRTARSRFAQWIAAPASLDANLRGTVLTIIGREADAATWTQLHKLGVKTTSAEQKRELYTALATARDPALATQTLALALTPELPPRDATTLVARVARAGEHAEAALAFALANLEALHAKLTAHQANGYVPELFIALPATEARAAELEAWAAKNLPPGAAPSVAKAADEIRFQAEFRLRALPEIEAWYSAKPK